MSRRIYKLGLLKAIEAFLDGSPTAHQRAKLIIQQYYKILNDKERQQTIDEIVWSYFVTALTNSVFNEDRHFLQETRKALLGQHRMAFQEQQYFMRTIGALIHPRMLNGMRT